MNNFLVNLEGRKLVEIELLKRGATSVTTGGNRKKYLSVKNRKNHEINLKVKAKRKGDWQTTIDEAIGFNTQRNSEVVINYWVFVEICDKPNFWVVPDKWIRNNIYVEHQKYLEKNNGHRPKNDDSNHHSIEEHRLVEWNERWDILEIA
ncbi:MAG: hypothetical protein GX640_21100 [Fibrobacter sp.]|nr:hypothetical protein [Fibrobacter sp.]